MKIDGLLKFSMIDFPGQISAVVFTRGCNLDCKYCHNPELIPIAPDENASYGEDEIVDYLEKRKNALDGIVITGGEPTVQPDLPDFIRKVKSLGYLVKLDTNGTNPQMLKELLDAVTVDFVAMDIKAPFEKYAAVCGKTVDTAAIKKSMDYLITGKTTHEFRTTYYKQVLNDADIETIRRMLPGGTIFKVQECLPVRAKDVLKVSK